MAPRKPTAGPHRYEYELGKRNYDFTTQIDQIIADTEARMLNVYRTALADTIEEAQTPVAKGGKMRVLTGFLRSSGIAALGSIPSGPDRGDKTKTYVWSADSVTVILAKMKMGDVFYFGWTANYAKYREAYDGFLESAVMNWSQKVDAAVEKLKKIRGM